LLRKEKKLQDIYFKAKVLYLIYIRRLENSNMNQNKTAANKAVAPDRRGRTALEIFRYNENLGIWSVLWKPLRQVTFLLT